jgi:hypothetical protein
VGAPGQIRTGRHNGIPGKARGTRSGQCTGLRGFTERGYDVIDEIKNLKRRVALLEGRNAERLRIETDLLETSRQWARLTSLGFYVDDKGFKVLLSANDVKDYADVYMSRIKQYSMALLRVNT